jgi:hypothetical protein
VDGASPHICQVNFLVRSGVGGQNNELGHVEQMLHRLAKARTSGKLHSTGKCKVASKLSTQRQLRLLIHKVKLRESLM